MHKDQILIFDADDTLWENNVLFERVIDGFLDWVSTPAERAATRAALDAIEAENAVTLGYGAEMFRQSLGDCLQSLTGRAPAAAESARIEELLRPLTDRHIELIDGVADALAVLAERHELLLLTKGNLVEQQRKVDASGIAHRFRSIHIVAEKTVDTYRQLSAELGLEADRTWMVGNSPKSDMHPAREAGLKTVFIPHEHTWVLEYEEQRSEEPTLKLLCFSELLEHF
ncbi:putative hydrolase of the HAD superfamily [Kitasatospora sp. MAP12-15]|uniref:HAD family hydrolase n=1 Tax=unclassified Kitasatospora TaxID=2633591 RepID=UPI0024737282|nr:HAD family hydrolase [Kitasatospora sp. MAP12-44]MDH6111727.1 putative hydrolase of the HAD superfamily [Kitasatospora sp. MAP12-44]